MPTSNPRHCFGSCTPLRPLREQRNTEQTLCWNDAMLKHWWRAARSSPSSPSSPDRKALGMVGCQVLFHFADFCLHLRTSLPGRWPLCKQIQEQLFRCFAGFFFNVLNVLVVFTEERWVWRALHLNYSVSSCYSPPGHRFEDVPGVRRHLVRKSTKGQIVHIGKDHKEPTTRARKQDRTPHEVKSYSHVSAKMYFYFKHTRSGFWWVLRRKQQRLFINCHSAKLNAEYQRPDLQNPLLFAACVVVL